MADTSWVDETDDEDTSEQGTPLPYEDPALTAELAEDDTPEWLGMRWREIPVEDQPEAWVWLRRWVDWFTEEYRIPDAMIPACWFQHSDTRAELYAAMCLEHKVWEAQAPTVAAVVYWQSQLPSLYDRLRTGSHAKCQNQGGHQDDKRSWVRAVDEDAWKRIMERRNASARFDRPSTGTRYVRAVLEDENGEKISHTKAIGLQSHSTDGDPDTTLKFSPSPGELDEVVQLHVDQGQRIAALSWQHSADKEKWTDVTEGEWR